MMMRSKLVWAGLALGCAAQTAHCAPLLEATSLYKDLAHGCRTLDLKQWSHPTRRVLDQAGVDIEKVELCNNDLYPIFTVSFKYDPNGATDKYFNRLYAEMVAANGYHSYSFVDPADGVIINIAVTGKRQISVSYEDFSPLRKP